MRRLHVIVVALSSLALVACAGESRSCTAMGAPSGVGFTIGDVVDANAGKRLTIRACVDEECEVFRSTPRDRRDQFTVGPESVDDGDERTVTLTVTTARGVTVFDGRRDVVPEKLEPNGPGCGTFWYAQVTASGEDELVQVPPG